MTGSGSGPGERGSSSGMRGRMLGPVQCAADFADPARVCDRLGTNVSRRRLLAGLLAGGATVSVLPAACASARSGDARLAAADSGAVVSTFFSDPGINFQMLFALGAAGYGASEVGEVKELIHFTAAEGAQFHCEPMAPQLRNERVFDWLERILEPSFRAVAGECAPARLATRHG